MHVIIVSCKCIKMAVWLKQILRYYAMDEVFMEESARYLNVRRFDVQRAVSCDVRFAKIAHRRGRQFYIEIKVDKKKRLLYILVV